ncbi:MAG: alpha-L-fucosidase [Myxococcales bacterium]|jgi:alpha-L-fucosidase|nr:alpha-L-fucosidase [Myxococcales bacterium]
MNPKKPVPLNRSPWSRPLSVGSCAKLILLCLQQQVCLALPATALVASGCVQSGPVLSDTPLGPTPDAVQPAPSPEQLAWQTQELSAFFHFGINTSSDKEQTDGTESPTIFNPTGLDPGQWMKTLQDAGFRQAMLTAKHQDGFCLWPTKCTNAPYSVAASSAWQAGKGDVVQQFVDAAHQANIRVGLALSPIDRHEPSNGTPAYEAIFKCQLTELLTKYGAIDEIWLWDFAGSPAFDWQSIHDLVHELQPKALLDVANVAGVAGGDVRSVGQSLAVPNAVDETSFKMLPGAAGAAGATPVWYPAEAVYSIRPGWFWHATEDTHLKTMTQLLDLYYNSVGRNSLLRLNVPPTAQGVLADPDVAQMKQFGDAIQSIYRSNLVAARPATADSVFKNAINHTASMAVDGKLDTFWAAGEGTTSARLEFDLGSERAFNVVSIQEPIALGERTTQHHLEAKSNGVWTTIASGTAIGQRKLHRVGAITASSIALVITKARALPAIAEFGVYQSAFP